MYRRVSIAMFDCQKPGAQELASHPRSIAQNPQQEPGFNRNPVGTCRFRGQSVAWSETKIPQNQYLFHPLTDHHVPYVPY